MYKTSGLFANYGCID